MSNNVVTRQNKPFEVISPYTPSGDQPKAIKELAARIRDGEQDVVLMGATGTGKSATTAWLIEELQRPALVLEPKKTLAAQLADEFSELLPGNAVEYFVSYYDYYQPEAYVPQTDTFIEKDSSINDEVERLRHSATNSLLTRRDTVVVSSVSCIYGLGTPEEYVARMIELERGMIIDRDALLRRFVAMQYVRNDMAFTRGTFRVRGDTIEIIPVYEELAIRIEMFGDEIESLAVLHPLTGDVIDHVDHTYLFPASHYVAGEERMKKAIASIEDELDDRLAWFRGQNKLLEEQRLRMRTTFDLEMLKEIGSCSGVENYSRHIDGRGPGTPPHTLLDYFPDDFLLIIDESHVTVPQIGAMFEGDMSRKRTLVDYGFRLPSAMDNRPLKWDEFTQRIGQTVYLSATPGPYELERSDGVVEQIIRPTGLVDPLVVVKPTEGQIDDLLVQLRELRLGTFDVLVGINLLREGLDLPEVSLVSILDADKEGFLRSTRSLIQTIGRAARNVSGEVHMYADNMTDSMNEAISETMRRREIQIAYNKEHGIDPQPLRKKISDVTDMLAREQVDTQTLLEGGYRKEKSKRERSDATGGGRAVTSGQRAEAELAELIEELSAPMMTAAQHLQFEVAARLRDEIEDLKKELRAMKRAH